MSAAAVNLAKPRITPLGSCAILFEAPGAFDIEHQRRVWALADAAAGWDTVVEAVPGMTNLMLPSAARP
jgi:5-oxoprolinase (ATP-hydrolysing) subunit B